MELKKNFKLIKNHLRTIIVLIPIVIGFVYAFFVAELKYESKAEFIVKNINGIQKVDNALTSMFMGGSSEKQDAKIVESFLKSFQTFEHIKNKFKLKEFYTSKKTDIVERLNENKEIEYFYNLYLKNLKIEFDEMSNISSIYFSINDNKLAKDIVEELLNISEEYLNNSNKKNANIEKEFIEVKIIENKEKLKNIENRLKEFQLKNKILDPEIEINFNNTLLASLIKEKIEKQSELNFKTTYLNENVPELKILKEKLIEIEKNINDIKNNFYSSNKNSLNNLFFEFQYLKNELILEKEIYKEALLSFELAKIESLKKSKVIEIISKPFIAEKEIYPNKFYLFITILIINLMLFGILEFIKALIKEHKD